METDAGATGSAKATAALVSMWMLAFVLTGCADSTSSEPAGPATSSDVETSAERPTKQAVTTESSVRLTNEPTTSLSTVTTTTSSSTTTTTSAVLTNGQVKEPDSDWSIDFAIDAYYPDPELLEDRLVLTASTNRCIYTKVTGATTTIGTNHLLNMCLSGYQAELFPVDAGTHTVTVTATRRDGVTVTETITFTTPERSTLPCQISPTRASSLPMQIDGPMRYRFETVGDCDDPRLRLVEQVAGFETDGTSLVWSGTGEPGHKQLILELVSIDGKISRFELDVEVRLPEADPEHPPPPPDPDLPCHLQIGGTGQQPPGGPFTVTIALGSSPWILSANPVGDCGDFTWDVPTLPSEVTVNGSLLAIQSDDGPERSVEFEVVIIAEDGRRVVQQFLVHFIEAGRG